MTTLQLTQSIICVGTDEDAFGMKRLPAGVFVKNIGREDALPPGIDSVTYFSASYDGQIWHQYYTLSAFKTCSISHANAIGLKP